MSEKTMHSIVRWWIPLLLAVALLVVSVWGAERSRAASRYEIAVENGYARAYAELAGTMEELSLTLGKLQAVSAPNQTVLLLDDIWRLSGTAVSLMSQIPQSHAEAEALNRLLVQLGDYAHSLSAKAVRGVGTSEAERAQLESLYSIARGVAADMNARLLAGDYPRASLDENAYYDGPDAGAASASEGTASDGAALGGMASDGANPRQEENLYKEQAGIESFPTLIYDGPFSESAQKLRPRGLTGAAVDEAQAQEIAEAATGIALSYQGMSNGKIRSYEFSGTGENGSVVDLSVSVQGGHIVSMMGSATGGAAGVPPESEVERYRDTALNYLEELGYEDMVATYAQYYGGCALINCAATEDGVILYSDLVKVWVDREDLHIVGLDARNYLFSHRERDWEDARISMAEAESLLSGRLNVESRAMALIPLTPETEALCYEFKCRLGGEAYILYINAQTGDEEQVFQILDSENGTLVL